MCMSCASRIMFMFMCVPKRPEVIRPPRALHLPQRGGPIEVLLTRQEGPMLNRLCYPRRSVHTLRA